MIDSKKKTSDDVANVDLPLLHARHLLATSLALAFADPKRIPEIPAGPWRDDSLQETAWTILADECGGISPEGLGLGEIQPDRVRPDHLAHLLNLDHDRREDVFRAVFGMLIDKECPPYETEYCHWKDPTYRAQQLADIAGFMCAFGLQPASNSGGERHDHVSLELEFVSFLLQKMILLHAANQPEQENLLIIARAIAGFLHDHVCWWFPTFCQGVDRKIARLESTLSTKDHGNLLDDLRAFREVALQLRAWSTAERILNHVEPNRRIIAPEVERSVPPPDVDDACFACTS